jgi:hypothetical protein
LVEEEEERGLSDVQMTGIARAERKALKKFRTRLSGSLAVPHMGKASGYFLCNPEYEGKSRMA